MVIGKILAAASLVCASLFSTTTPSTTNAITANSKQEMLDEVNRLRSKGCHCGRKYMPPVKPVTWNNHLEKAALAHANDMLHNDFFDHKGSNGSNIGDRAKRAGYKWVAVGENIAEGFDSFSETLFAWKNSPGHCRNLMQAGFDEMAVSRIDDIWVQDLGASKGKYALTDK